VTDGRALAREFLEQQRQLGGNPVILPEGSTPGNTQARPAREGSDLPPPGISYDPPGGDLFSNDPVPQAISLDAIAQLVAGCTKCRLCEGRRHTVPGEGAADARLVVVGEGPGRVEDETGRPFVGPAGENRLPQFDEIAACVPYLFRQIDIVKPSVILAMGGTAAQTLLNTKQSLGALRNFVHRFRGIPLIVTYHPAALLRNPNWKKPTWDDVRIARRLIA